MGLSWLPTDTRRGVKSWSRSTCTLPAGTLPSCFGAPAGNTCPFRGLFSAIFFCIFGCFLLVTLLLQMAPSIVLNCCLLFQTRRPGRASWRKYMCYISLAQAGVRALLAGSSMLMNQQNVSNKLPLNRSSHKTRLWTGQLMKML